MKHFFRKFAMVLALAFVFVTMATAQDLMFPDINTLTPQNFFSATIQPLFGLVVILSGYLSAYIPGVNKWAPFYRVLAFALALGLGFYLYGADIWKLAFTYFMSSGLYAVFLQHIIKSPKAVAG